MPNDFEGNPRYLIVDDGNGTITDIVKVNQTDDKIIRLRTPDTLIEFGQVPKGTVEVVLADYQYWGPRQDELDEWLAEYGCNRTGTLASFPTEDLFVLFKMRWL